MAELRFPIPGFKTPLSLSSVFGPLSGNSYGQAIRSWWDRTDLEQLHLWQMITATNSPMFFTPDRFLSHPCGRWWGEYHKTMCCFLFYHGQSFTLVEWVQRKGFTLTDGLTNTWNIWSITIIADLFWRTRTPLILRDCNCVSLCERERNFVFRNESFITASHIDILPHTQLQKIKQLCRGSWGTREPGCWLEPGSWLTDEQVSLWSCLWFTCFNLPF